MDTKNASERLSYAIGVQIAGNLKQNGFEELEPKSFSEGIIDILEDKKLQISFEEVQQEINAHYEKFQAKAKEQNAEAGITFLNENKQREDVIELCDFILNVLKIKDVGAAFPYKIGVHKSCHGLRGLRLGSCSEIPGPSFSFIDDLLQKVEGSEIMELSRKDECCGFGGTFAVSEEAVSVKMGKDRIKDHLDSGVEVITATDTSCLMHLEGLINRNNQPLKVLHIAEILNSQLKSKA